ncbi:MAG: hypothetical protein AAGL24_19420 [Pseudomonadota bacterium]
MTTSAANGAKAEAGDRVERTHDSLLRDVFGFVGTGWRTLVALGPLVVVYALCSAALPWLVFKVWGVQSGAVLFVARILEWVPTLMLAYIVYRSCKSLLAAGDPRPHDGFGEVLAGILICLAAICAVYGVAEKFFDPVATFLSRSIIRGDIMAMFFFPFEPLTYCLAIALVFSLAGPLVVACLAGRMGSVWDAVHLSKTRFGWTAGRLLVVLAGVPIVWYLSFWAVASGLDGSLSSFQRMQFGRVFNGARYVAEAFALLLGAAVVVQAYVRAQVEPDMKT